MRALPKIWSAGFSSASVSASYGQPSYHTLPKITHAMKKSENNRLAEEGSTRRGREDSLGPDPVVINKSDERIRVLSAQHIQECVFQNVWRGHGCRMRVLRHLGSARDGRDNWQRHSSLRGETLIRLSTKLSGQSRDLSL